MHIKKRAFYSASQSAKLTLHNFIKHRQAIILKLTRLPTRSCVDAVQFGNTVLITARYAYRHPEKYRQLSSAYITSA